MDRVWQPICPPPCKPMFKASYLTAPEVLPGFAGVLRLPARQATGTLSGEWINALGTHPSRPPAQVAHTHPRMLAPNTPTPPLPHPLQHLLDKPQALFALVLSPTRELAIQIAEQFEALGAGIGVKCAVLVGGIDMMAQVRFGGQVGGAGRGLGSAGGAPSKRRDWHDARNVPAPVPRGAVLTPGCAPPPCTPSACFCSA